MRTCPECYEPVSGRRKRHPDCKRAAHARAEKARRDAIKDREPGSNYDLSSTEIGGEVIDYTSGQTKPPSFSGVPPKANRRELAAEVVDYTKGGHDGPGKAQPVLDYSRVPASVRQDRVRAARMAQQIARQDADSGPVMSWDSSLQAIEEQAEAHMVDFSRRPDMSMPVGLDHLGRPYPRSRRWR